MKNEKIIIDSNPIEHHWFDGLMQVLGYDRLTEGEVQSELRTPTTSKRKL